MSIEQLVRYKHHLKKISSEFVRLANVLDVENLEIAAAKVADNLHEKAGNEIDLKYKLYLLDALLYFRRISVIKQRKRTSELQDLLKAECMRINNEKKMQYQAQLEWRAAAKSSWKRRFFEKPLRPNYLSVDVLRESDYLVNRIANTTLIDTSVSEHLLEEVCPARYEIRDFALT